MSYGSPEGEEGLEAYYTDIRRGRRPSDELLEELRERYRAIGGSPLAAITRAQARLLGEALGVPVFTAFKHAPPFLPEGAAEARAAGVDRLIALPLAPHYSKRSLGEYEERLRPAWDGEMEFVRGFHDHPAFVEAVRGLLREALATWKPERVFFTAHSLPERIIVEGDPYLEQLRTTCRLISERFALPPWQFAFQSKSTTGEPWLGPDLLEALGESGARSALVCPIGFVADHLEVLYDLDVETQAWARERGVEVRRTASFNERPEFIAALAAVVRPLLRGGSGGGGNTLAGGG